MTKKATAREPFLPFFVGDFMAATAEWEGEAVSLYATLLLHQWALGSIPSDPKKVCKLVRWDWELFSEHWKTVRRKFRMVRIRMEDDDELQDRLINPRLEVHREKTSQLRRKNAENGTKGAQARWQKDSDRHAGNIASATKNGSGRHTSEVAGATLNDGERHSERHQNRDGASDGIPSHPIPSHPIPERVVDTSPHPEIVSGATRSKNGGADQQPTPQAVLAIELRQLNVRTSSLDPILIRWLDEGFTREQILDAVNRSKQTLGEEEQIGSKYIDRVLRSPPKRSARERQQAENIDASQQWLREQEAKDAANRSS